MSSITRRILGPAALLLTIGLVAAHAASCSRRSDRSSDAQKQIKDGLRPVSESLLPDRAISDSQTRLLDVAFSAASAFPLHPHVKNRSRAQEEVVAACLELDQPKRALDHAQSIENWRRGACLANYAFYCAEKGQKQGLEPYLELALQIADDQGKLEGSQDWQRHRIRVRVARTYLLIGQVGRASELGAGAEASEAGALAALSARLEGAPSVDQQLAAMDAALATGNLDQIRNALDVCIVSFGRNYGDAQQRSRIEEKIRSCYKKLPIEIGIDTFMTLGGTAVEKKDPAKAVALLAEARAILDVARLLPEDRMRYLARLASAGHRAGDLVAARASADAVLAEYASIRPQVVDIFRAGALRPLAETYHVIGDDRAALDVYRKVLEEGVSNPNARPRADDLVATCLSMARHGIEPDAALWTRIRQVRDGLGDPW